MNVTVTESDIAGAFRRDARAERQLTVWCPDWPVVAAATELGLSLQLPLAVFDHGEVFACSTMARKASSPSLTACPIRWSWAVVQ